MFLFFEKNCPYLCPQGHLVVYFKLALLATYSEKIKIMTPLYYINRGIKWGGRWSQNWILTICNFQHMQILNFWRNIWNGQKMHFYWQNWNSETSLRDNRGTKWVGRSSQIQVSTIRSVFFRYSNLGNLGHFCQNWGAWKTHFQWSEL